MRRSRVELAGFCSQYVMYTYSGHVAMASASDTRFLSPPLTPRIAASPILVFNTWPRPTQLANVSTALFIVSLDEPRSQVAVTANLKVSPTVRVGK